MGKDLKGKELGEGISQRKDGRYTVRISNDGKRTQKYFATLSEAKKWKIKADYKKEVLQISDGTVSFGSVAEMWLNMKKQTVKYTSYNTILATYQNHIKEYLESMEIGKIKPLHIINMLNGMSETHRQNSIDLVRRITSSIFIFAIENRIIQYNPVTRSTKVTSKVEKKNVSAMSIDQQKLFTEWCKQNPMRNKFLFVLQTGLRAGELAALKWSDIDFENGIIHVSRNMVRRNIDGEYISTETSVKTKNSIRDIPLTEEAKRILFEQKKRDIMSVYVFLTSINTVITSIACDKELQKIKKKLGMDVLSMHILRHTFATRCVEGGMNPKILQSLLGHSKISTTLDTYVHVTDEEKRSQIQKTEAFLSVV